MRVPVGIGGVVAALSVTSDLTRGHPQGEAMRACLLATAVMFDAVGGGAAADEMVGRWSGRARSGDRSDLPRCAG